MPGHGGSRRATGDSSGLTILETAGSDREALTGPVVNRIRIGVANQLVLVKFRLTLHNNRDYEPDSSGCPESLGGYLAS